MNNETDHMFHVWINSEGDRLHEWQQANPTGETTTETRRGKAIETPTKPRTPLHLIDTYDRDIYAFKSAMQLLPHLGKMITKDRTKALPLVHQQCLHSAPEPMEENHLQCWLGQKLNECPILKRLRESFDEQRKREYYASVTDEQVDQVAAHVCIWHMLMGTDGFVDWNEGAVQDSSDRKFWARVYDNLSQEPEGQPECED